MTVDEEIQREPPSVLIGTVDKIAQLPAKPGYRSLFGLGDHPVDPPDLILQDELHLIDGPLGSMVGLYETAIDHLARHPKYITSTATVRAAGQQVASLYLRPSVAVFPPPGLRASDSFFARIPERHPLDEAGAGRLFLGFFAPGRGPLSPTRDLYASLLGRANALAADPGRTPEGKDRFWTLVGYFNAIRELSSVKSMLDQDIIQKLEEAPGGRTLEQSGIIELSSRLDAAELPALLDRLALAKGQDGAVDAVLATSMFGTGVDVDRLGLMVINGMPKSLSSYIQAAGRVGRARAGLVVTFFRASRPRDLDHYEFFSGIHSGLYRHVEPVTVAPFSPGAMSQGLGPVAVAILRAMAGTDENIPIGLAAQPGRIQDLGTPARQALSELMERRAQGQPQDRRPPEGRARDICLSILDRWEAFARQDPDLRYQFQNPPRGEEALPRVVLGGDAHFRHPQLAVIQSTPTSLRGVEATSRFQERKR